MALIVLSHYQMKPLLAARDKGATEATLSPDLNLTSVRVNLRADGAEFPGGEILQWDHAHRIAVAENKCYILENGNIEEISGYSDITSWPRSLFPTENAPTMLVSGLTMHRIRGTDPYADTLTKIRAVRPSGSVLDTATGLGYTAIEAAKSADEVLTVEIDPVSIDIAQKNPWSQPLFQLPAITQVIADVFDFVEDSPDATYSCVIHDPPTFALAGDLYSGDFYRQIFRILRRKGRIFHYVGDVNSKSGQGIVNGVIRRLHEAGFERIERRPEAYGLVAYK